MADENIVTNIVAKSDFSNLIADLNKVSFSLSKLQDQLIATNKTLAAQVGVMNRSFADTLRSTGQYSTHFVSLTSDVDKFGMQLERGQLKLSKFFNVYTQHAKTSGGLVRDLARQQVQLQNAIIQPLGKNAEGLMQYNVHIPKGLDLVKNRAAIARQELMIMNKVVQEGANQLINWGKNTQWAGRQLTVGLTVPLAAFGKASADAFRQADEQLVRLTKVYGGVAQTSAKELGKVRDDVARTAADLAKSYGAAFKDTLGLAADIAATGKTGNELLGSIKETTRLAVLGEVDRQEAMKATLAIQTAFKQNTDQLSESINFLNAVENQTSTTLNDLVEAIPKAGPIIKGLGGSVQDLALYLTAMREGGINATEGANALKSALASLINPTNVAVAKFQTFGIDLLGIVNNNAGDVTKTLFALQAALDRLDPLQKQQAIEQLFGKFQFSRLNALFENLGRQGSQTLQVLDLMKTSSQELGDLASRELTAVTESASGRYRRAVEGLRADLAGIGDQFLRINTSLITFVDGVIQFVKRLPDPIKQALGFMGMLTAAAGPLIMLTGVLGNFFGYIIKGAYHFKSLFKGGEGWKLLTPEILAAQKAGNLVEQTFYSDAKAAAILKQSINELALSYDNLAQKASVAAMTTNPTVSTVGGTTIMPGRVVNPRSPYVGAEGTRAAGHHIPRSIMSESQRLSQTIHSFTPVPIPLNQRIGAAPQIFAEGDLPRIPGLTTAGGVSTGIVAGEAAKWHALMGTLSMMTKREVADLKKEIARTGTFSTDINTTFGQLLPAMTKLTSNAAKESALIVQQLQAGKLTVEAARAKIIAINAQLEQMMAQTTSQVATSLGRTANLTQVPLINQPIVSQTGKANIKEIFRPKRPSAQIIDRIARALGVRTYGGGYSTETTMPKRMNMGGSVVPGPNINADVVPALLTPGEFVVNRKATAANLPLLTAINNGMGNGGLGYNDGGMAQLQSAHLMRSYQLLEDPLIQKALIGAGQDPKRLTSLTFQGYGQGTTAAIPRQINSLMAQTWQGSQQERSIRIAENMKLPRHLRGDIIPLTNKDAKIVAKFYQAVGLPAVSSFFSRGDYQKDLIKRIAIANAKSRGVSSTTDFGKFYEEELLRTSRAFSKGATHESIKKGLINEFIVDPKTGQFRPDALSKAYTTNVSRQRVRVSTNTSVPYTINRGSEEYSARQAARFGGGRWSNILPLASRVLSRGRLKMNRGGMVPQRYAMGGIVGQLVAGTAGYYGGQAAGSMVGGDIGGTFGGISGSIAAPLLMSKIGGGLLNPYILAATAVAGLTVGLKKYNDGLQETARLNRLAFAGAVKPVKDFDSEIEKVRANILATRQAYDLFLAQNTQIGVSGVKLTVEEFRKLQDTVKKTYPDIVKLLNQTPTNKITETIANLKAQFIAAGESAEKATQKAYALLTVSNKSAGAAGIISTQQVRDVNSMTSALNQMLRTLSTAQNVGGSKGFIASLTGTFSGLDASYESLVKAGKASEALKQQFDLINNSQAKNLKLTQSQISELSKQDPLLASLLKTSNSIGDAYAIWRINLAGVSRDISDLNSQQLQNLAIYTSDVQNYFTGIADVSSKVARTGPFGLLAETINTFNTQQNKAQAVAKNIQISAEERIKTKEKEIDLIKKEADARKKALQEQQSQEDTKLQIQKEQLAYQDAIASGNMSAAAQAQINIKRLIGASQLKAAETAIEEDAQKRIEKIQATIESLRNATSSASKTTTAGKSTSPYEGIYNQLVGLMQKISLAGGNITAQDQQTYNLLIKQLQSTAGGAKIASGMNLAPSQEIKDRPFSTSVLGYEGGNLAEKSGAAQNQIAQNTSVASKYLEGIYGVLARKEVGTGLGTKASPVIAGAVPSTKTSGGGTYKTSDNQLTENGKKYIVQQYKLQAGDYFEYNKQRYRVETGYDAKFVRPLGYAVKAAMGGYVKDYGMGGKVFGVGTSTSDSIPAMLSNGEYVVRASAVQAIGVPMLDQINKMAMGGLAAKYDVGKTVPIPPQNGRYNKGGVVNYYNVGGLAVNAAEGQSPMEIARMTMAMMNSVSVMQAKQAGLPKVVGRGYSV